MHQGWLKADEAKRWQTRLEQQLQWQQPVVQVYGRRHPVPRMTVFLANEGLQYRYSGAVTQLWMARLVPTVAESGQYGL